MILPINVRIFLALSLLSVFACKTPSETISEKPALTKTNTPQYEKGVLVFQVRSDYKTSLPDYDKDSPSLGEYPYLGSLLAPYKVSSITSIASRKSTGPKGKFYKVHYDESISAKEFIEALRKIEIIQHVEKIPINKPK